MAHLRMHACFSVISSHDLHGFVVHEPHGQSFQKTPGWLEMREWSARRVSQTSANLGHTRFAGRSSTYRRGVVDLSAQALRINTPATVVVNLYCARCITASGSMEATGECCDPGVTSRVPTHPLSTFDLKSSKKTR